MILVLGLLLCGAAAAGLWLADSFMLLLAAWILGLVLHAGLAACGRSRRVAAAAREAFLAEIAGACALAWPGLTLMLATGANRLGPMAQGLELLEPGQGLPDWLGLGVLLAAVCRLGLPPLPWWPGRLAASPPAVRVFLLAGLHPATALVLWHRLAPWLQPWHQTIALWFGSGAALLLILAAAGERNAARRAAWLGASQWAGLLAAGREPLWTIWLLAAGLALVQLSIILVRWPAARQKLLLVAGGAVVLAVGLLTVRERSPSLPAILRLSAWLLAIWILWRWSREQFRLRSLPPPASLRRPAVAALGGLARLGQTNDPLSLLAGVVTRCLGRLVADFDRVVLAGVAEGLGWIGLGSGWLVAWLDRRGQDAVYLGALGLLRLGGQLVVYAAGGSQRRVLLAALLVLLGLIWLGSAAG